MTKILIVDDNEKIRNLMAIYLKREGFEIYLSEDGEDALNMLETLNVDLMIADIMMPHVDGYELVSSLRISNYNFPILMVTAKDQLVDKKQGFEVGADDYLIKPFEMEELVLRIKALLRRYKISISNTIKIKDTTLDLNSLSVSHNEQVIELPNKDSN